MNEQIKSLVRTGLKVLGAFLIAKGYSPELIHGVVQSADVVELISGAVTLGAGVVWSNITHKA